MNEDVARNQIGLAIGAIRQRHTIIGAMLAAMPIILATAGRGCVIGWIRSRLSLRMGIDLVTDDIESIEGVLLHEVMHLILNHHAITIDGGNADVLAVAKDLCANEFLDRPPPRHTAVLADFAGFPRGESCITRYGRLLRLLESQPEQQDDATDEEPQANMPGTDDGITGEGDGDGEGEGEGQGEGEGEGKGDGDGENKGQEGKGEGEGEGNEDGDDNGIGAKTGGDGDGDTEGTDNDQADAQDGCQTGADNGDSNEVGDGATAGLDDGEPQTTGNVRKQQGGSTVDGSHQGGEPGENEKKHRENQNVADAGCCPSLLKAVVGQALSGIDQSQQPSELEVIIMAHTGNLLTGVGCTPGNILQAIAAIDATAAIHWTSELRRFLGRYAPVVSRSYQRAPRRFSALLGIVPGRRLAARRPIVQVAIDTSGSLTAEQLGVIANELRHLAHGRSLVIVECDCEVQRIYAYQGAIASVQGRGGTDFSPPFSSSVVKQTRADVIVYFTDGLGDPPVIEVKLPTLWVIYGDQAQQPPSTWGDVIWMRNGGASR